MKFKIEAESERDIKQITINVKYEDESNETIPVELNEKPSKTRKSSKEGVSDEFNAVY